MARDLNIYFRFFIGIGTYTRGWDVYLGFFLKAFFLIRPQENETEPQTTKSISHGLMLFLSKLNG